MDFERNSFRLPYGDCPGATQPNFQFPRGFERTSLKFPYGNWPWALQTNLRLMLEESPFCVSMWKLTRGAGCPIPISHRFWKEFLQVSIQTLTRVPQKFFRLWKEFLWVTIWTRSSPDKFPTNFDRNSFRLPYGSWSGAPRTNSPLVLKDIPLGFHLESDQVRPRPVSKWFWNEFLKLSTKELTRNSPQQFPLGFHMEIDQGCPRPFS